MTIKVIGTKVSDGTVIAYKQVRLLGTEQFYSRFPPIARDGYPGNCGKDIRYISGAIMQDTVGLGYYLFEDLATAKNYDWKESSFTATLKILIPYGVTYEYGDFEFRNALRSKTIVVLNRV